MSALVDAGVRRGPGRPRDEHLDGALIDAVLALIDEGVPVTLNAVVKRAGASRAAVYRRWPSLTALIAAALDMGRTVPPEVPEGADLREAILAVLGLAASDPLRRGHMPSAAGYSEERFRQRIRLVMSDRALQREYWTTHVARRRAPLERALRRGVDRGILRADLDVEACIDSLAGVAYYQVVVRGDAPEDARAAVRMRAAFEVIWRGMLA